MDLRACILAFIGGGVLGLLSAAAFCVVLLVFSVLGG